MTLCTVVNLKTDSYDVYIGRGSRWGNPFIVRSEKGRKKAIQDYKKYIIEKINRGEITHDHLVALKGKRLGCFCRPLPCHGEVIADIVNAL